MPIRRTARFDRAYLKLPPSVRAKIDRAIRLLEENWRHPGLRAKRLSGHQDIFYARIDRSYRMTYERLGDDLLLRNVGPHDETLKNP